MSDALCLENKLPAGKRDLVYSLKDHPLDDLIQEVQRKPKRFRGGNQERNSTLKAILAAWKES